MIILLALTYASVTCLALLIEPRHVHKDLGLWVFLTFLITFFMLSWSSFYGPPLRDWLFPHLNFMVKADLRVADAKWLPLIGFIVCILI